MKTLKDIETINLRRKNMNMTALVWFKESNLNIGLEKYTKGTHPFVDFRELKQEAINILKQNKEINTADWIEFFGIEEEFRA